jgi:hypothetical protein
MFWFVLADGCTQPRGQVPPESVMGRKGIRRPEFGSIHGTGSDDLGVYGELATGPARAGGWTTLTPGERGRRAWPPAHRARSD